MRKPFFRKQNQRWYVWHNGRQLSLGEDEQEAYRQWQSLVDAARVNALNAPLASVAESFLEWNETHASPSTQDWYGNYLGSLCLQLGTMAITSVRPLDISKWVRECKYTAGAERAALRCAKRLFAWALEQGVIQLNPLRSIKLQSCGRRDVLISDADHQRILKRVPKRTKDFITSLSETGCRPGEVARVTAKHFQPDIGAWVLTKHKTSKKVARPRVIYLTATVLEIHNRLAAENPEGPLFLNERGKPWKDQSVRCIFTRLRKSIKDPPLPAGTVAYSYRHTFATNALVAGVDVATVAELMGTSPAMIERHYGHLSKKSTHLRSALQKVAANA